MEAEERERGGGGRREGERRGGRGEGEGEKGGEQEGVREGKGKQTKGILSKR